MTDNELLERYADTKDHGAFASLARAHAGWVYACAKRLVGDQTMAEDVSQATFILLARKAGRIGGDAHLGGWLFQTTRRCAREALRAAARRRKHEREAAMIRQNQSSAGKSEAEWSEVAAVLDAAVADLATADRNAVLLRYYQQRPLAQVGQALGISEEAARKRVDRAVERLRDLLAGRGVTAGTMSLGTMLAAHVATNAPQTLVHAILHGSSAAGTATGIAAGVSKAATFAKAKLIVACAAGVLVISTAAQVYVARTGAEAPTAATKPTASPKPAAATLMDEAILGAVPTVYSYHLIVDAAEANKLNTIARQEPTASTGYTALRTDQQALHDALDDWESRGVIHALAADNFTSPMLTNPVQIVSSQSASQISLNWRNAAGGTPVQNAITGSAMQWYDRRNQACVLRLLPADVTWQVSQNGANPPSVQRSGSMVFDGPLPPGEALLFVSPPQTIAGRQFVHVRTYETFKCEPGDDTYLSSLDQFTAPWITRGLAGLTQMCRKAAVWDSMAPADEAIKPAWRQTVSATQTVGLRGIADGNRWPFCFWDGAGEPVRYVGGFIPSNSVAGHRTILVELASETRPYASDFLQQRLVGAKHVWSYVTAFDLPPGKDELEIGVGTGPWGKAQRIDVGVPLRAGEARIELGNVSNDGRWLIPSFGLQNSANVEWRIYVVQKDGTRLEAPVVLGLIVQRGPASAVKWINGPMGNGPANFDHFEVSWRPRRWFTFRGFAMEPKTPPPTEVTVEKMRTAQHVLWEADDANLRAQVDEWRKIPPSFGSPQALMRLACGAAEKGDTAAITALFEPLADDKQRKLAEALAQVMVLSQRMPMSLEKRFGREVAQRTFMGTSKTLETQCATWAWPTDGTDANSPGGAFLRKQQDGEWRLAIRQDMLQIPPDSIEKQIKVIRDLDAGIEDNSLKTVEEVQERLGNQMIRMLEEMSKKPTTRP